MTTCALSSLYTPVLSNGYVMASQGSANTCHSIPLSPGIGYFSFTGNLIWDVGTPVFTPVVTIYNYLVIAAGSNFIVAYFLNNGVEAWQQNLTSIINSNTGYIITIPTVGDNVVVVGLMNPNALMAFNAISGAYLWRINLTSPITAMPAYGDGYFYFGIGNGTLYSVSPTGSVKWVYKLGTPATVTPTIADGKLYVGLGNGTFLAINDASGSIIWSDTFNSPITAPPVVSINGTIYVGTEDGGIYAINDTTGALLSKYSVEYSIVSLVLNDGYLIALDSQANVYWLNKNNLRNTLTIFILLSVSFNKGI